jgi:hypothetical protein
MEWPYALIDNLGNKVGLYRCTELPAFEGIESLPDEVAFWISDYAYLLLWPISEMNTEALRVAGSRGQDWLDHAIANAEGKSGSVIDGYLVLVLALPASPQVAAEARRLESSTQVCRKQVVWPETDTTAEPWRRLLNVTVLGLPDGWSSEVNAGWPELDLEAQEIWQRVDKSGHNAAAEGDIEGEPT